MSLSWNKSLYYCHQCKKVLQSAHDFLFVENKSHRGFCSDQCIEEYFSPLIAHFAQVEQDLRSKLDIGNEEQLEEETSEGHLMRHYRSPSEVWRVQNELEEEFFIFVSKYEGKNGTFWLISTCLLFDERPSYVFMVTATKHESLVKEFRVGEKIEWSHSEKKTEQEDGVIKVDESVMQLIENKKSALLAALIDDRSEADIPFEQFAHYEDYLGPTLENPDEVYQHRDNDGDTVLIYIKAHERKSVSFFYFVYCYRYQEHKSKEEITLIPILSFPTLDGELYRQYKKGDMISGNSLN